ncbi:MAG TPA: class II fumarate hydratase [Candidatus Sumerlaeota bacterium]|nr:class II fumarate hydratase [Candidatus Sumerlaeota bacterium]
MAYRTEKDSMGEMQVPAEALYGAQTRRAELNFPVSGWPMPPAFIQSMGRIKRAAARVNRDLGKLDPALASVIEQAASEVVEGRLDGQFVVDVFQTGSGTSTNMNANEVIANRAIQILGGTMGSRAVHPNDHVNMGQSSNDIIPAALHLAAALGLQKDLLPALSRLEEVLSEKARVFDGVMKIGRTHLQDATPVRLGQVFSGYAGQIHNSRSRVEQALDGLGELPIGGTAVGTGINTHPEFGARMAAQLAQETGLNLREAANHFEAQASKDAVVQAAATLKTLAVTLTKIANDIRFLASGPRCGLGELELPATQPGSSIMPGKVNPVICESVMQVAAYVVGADAAIAYGTAILSNFELSVAMPLMAHQLLESIRLLSNVLRVFVENALEGLKANESRCEGLVEGSLALCTSLAPLVGYDTAAAVAKEAHATGRTVREVARDKALLDPETLDRALDPRAMTEPEKV